MEFFAPIIKLAYHTWTAAGNTFTLFLTIAVILSLFLFAGLGINGVRKVRAYLLSFILIFLVVVFIAFFFQYMLSGLD